MPISNSCVDGISDFSTILPGTKVFVFFMDRHQQKPFYFAVLPFFLKELPDFEKGFSDPAQQYPSDDYLNESSISRLARNEKIDETCVKIKNDNLETWDVNGAEIKEPESGYDAEYPYNRVIETPSGIIIELDSTPGGERIHIYHPLNSFVEIQADGSKVSKTSGNEFDITLEDKHLYVGGLLTLKVDGDASIEVEGDLQLKCNGSADVTLGDDSVITAEGDLLIDGDGDVLISSTGNIEVQATGDVDIEAGGDVNIESTAGSVKIDCLTCEVDASVSADISAGGATIQMVGGIISLN